MTKPTKPTPKKPKLKQPKNTEHVELPLNRIGFHPLMKDLPLSDKESAEIADLAEDIKAKGVLHRVFVIPNPDKDGHWLLIDGRHRYLGSFKANKETIPATIKKAEDAEGIILSSLILRKHYCKGAQAYLAVPFLERIVEKARELRCANLRNAGIEKIEAAMAGPVVRLEDECVKMGFSADHYQRAVKLREIFAQEPEYKALVEPKILSGEVGLGAAIAGFAGRATTAGKQKPATNYLTLGANGKLGGLMARTITTLANGFNTWTSLDLQARAVFKAEWDKLVAALPEDLQ